MSQEIVGAGTAEDAWRPWLAEQDWPPLDTTALTARRLVVVAAHPDDEVLGAGGLLALLTSHRPIMIWASDGEASHPDAGLDLHRLAERRRAESASALQVLGVTPGKTHCLALPDGRVAEHEDVLRNRLRADVDPDTVVLAPWRGDGHPDHDSCGRAAATVAADRGATLLEYPIWAWHWARPGDERVPWERARRLSLTGDVAAAKSRAIDRFTSQTTALGPRPEQAAVLPPEILARFRRGEEVLFW